MKTQHGGNLSPTMASQCNQFKGLEEQKNNSWSPKRLGAAEPAAARLDAMNVNRAGELWWGFNPGTTGVLGEDCCVRGECAVGN